jgi:hypothetical protein
VPPKPNPSDSARHGGSSARRPWWRRRSRRISRGGGAGGRQRREARWWAVVRGAARLAATVAARAGRCGGGAAVPTLGQSWAASTARRQPSAVLPQILQLTHSSFQPKPWTRSPRRLCPAILHHLPGVPAAATILRLPPARACHPTDYY